MNTASPSLNLFLQLAKVQSALSRRFETGLRGLGYSEFMILYYLSQAHEGKLKRIDLANKLGLTASGITRLLLPMEKTGVIKRESHAQDARISYVMLEPIGKSVLSESLEGAEYITEEIIPASKMADVESLSKFLTDISGTIT